MVSTIWFHDISILYDKKKLLEILPSPQYDSHRNINSIMRFSIYFFIIYYMFLKKEGGYNFNTGLYILICIALFTYIYVKSFK